MTGFGCGHLIALEGKMIAAETGRPDGGVAFSDAARNPRNDYPELIKQVKQPDEQGRML
jgi:hypothetical protein